MNNKKPSKEEKLRQQIGIEDSVLIKTSSGAYCFKDIYKKDKKEIKKENVKTFLINHFCLEEYPSFIDKFDEAVSGDGDESKKMISIRSSSLCALLFFFNVSDQNPIYINGEKYTKSYFEVKNQVFDNPSNMDVVLTNIEEKRILFIECKFSEYLNHGKIQISNAYRNNAISNEIYDIAMQEQLFEMKPDKAEEGYSYYASKDCYMGGLKQIISHYVGLTNYAKRNIGVYMKNEKRKEIYNNEYETISFIEVLFKLNGFESERKSYETKSNKLVDILNTKKSGVNYLKGTTYQEILKNSSSYKKKLPESVKKFYKF